MSRRDRLRNPAPWLSDGSTSGYAFRSKRKGDARKRRFGILDAAVVLVVLVAVWSRTPVGER